MAWVLPVFPWSECFSPRYLEWLCFALPEWVLFRLMCLYRASVLRVVFKCPRAPKADVLRVLGQPLSIHSIERVDRLLDIAHPASRLDVVTVGRC